MYVICLPTEHQGVHKTLFRNVRALQDRIRIWISYLFIFFYIAIYLFIYLFIYSFIYFI